MIASKQIWLISQKTDKPTATTEERWEIIGLYLSRGTLRDYVFEFKVMDTVRLQLVRGNHGVRTCSYVGKLQLTDDWQKPWQGPF